MEERIASRLNDLMSASPLQQHVDRRSHPVSWQLRFEFAAERSLTAESASTLDLHLSDPLELGTTPDSAFNLDLTPFAHNSGVSRRHVKLEPHPDGVLITDLGSTNGTRVNNRILSPNLPQTLQSGDLVRLGSLEFYVSISPTTVPDSSSSAQQIELADALAMMAKAITSQLDLDQILSRALEHAISLTSAREAAIWLVDHNTNTLFLEAESGLEDETIQRLRLPVTDTQAGQVVATGQPLRVSRTAGGEQVKVKTGYIVEAVLYVPLIHGETTFGVMSVVHREAGKVFSKRDEKLLASLAEFAAVALHNSRIYQQLADADRLKGEMIQNISHEFRTPLHYMVGYSGLLLDYSDLDEEVSEGLRVIALQAHKLSRMVENFVSIDTARRDALHRESVDVTTLIADLLRSSKLLAAEKQLALSMEVEPDLPLAVANRLAITQVLDNLMSNSLKFTPDGGTITVSAYSANDQVIISITDTGIGIPPEAHTRIFERFYQVDGSATRKYGGVGLGLSVCKSIIDAHNGQIWLTSEEGSGTTFSFSLPTA